MLPPYVSGGAPLGAEILDLGPSARAAECDRAPFEIVGGTAKKLSIVGNRVVATVEVAGIAELRDMIRERRIILEAKVSGNVADPANGPENVLVGQHDERVVLFVGDTAAATEPVVGRRNIGPVPCPIGRKSVIGFPRITANPMLRPRRPFPLFRDYTRAGHRELAPMVCLRVPLPTRPVCPYSF